MITLLCETCGHPAEVHGTGFCNKFALTRPQDKCNCNGWVPYIPTWLDLVRKWEAQRLITRQEGWELRTYETLPDFLSGRLRL